MIYRKSLTITGTASTETIDEIIRSTDIEHVHVRGVYFTEVTGTRQGDATLRCYIGREKIEEIPYSTFLDGSASHLVVITPYIEINTDLDVGQAMYVGHVSGGTASDFTFTVEYEFV